MKRTINNLDIKLGLVKPDFGLPDVSPGKGIRKRKAARKEYIDLIQYYIDNPLDKNRIDKEIHHILPKCLGGTNNSYNLIALPIRDHIRCHLLLHEMYPDNISLSFAVHMMFSPAYKSDIEFTDPSKHRDLKRKIIQKEFSIDDVEKARSCFLAAVRSEEFRDGRRKPRSEETKEKLRQANLGKKASIEARLKMSLSRKGENNWNYGKHLSEETKEKLSKANKGRKRDPDAVKRSADGIRGEKNWTYGKHLPMEMREKISKTVSDRWKENPDIFGKARTKVIDPNGREFNSVKEAAEFWGIKPSTLGSKLSRNKDKEGWQYFTTGRKASKRKTNKRED